MEKEVKPKIHDFFELSYANYLAIPRSILQSMPDEWQEKFVELLDELDDTFEWRRNGCWVNYRDKKGRYVSDDLSDYDRGRRRLTPEQVFEITNKHNSL